MTEGASPSASAAATRAATLDLARDGWSLYERGDVEGARNALRAAARDPSAPAWVRYALGQAAFATSRVEEAARAWEQVRAAVPEFRAIYFDLVDAYLVADDPGRAIAVLRAAEARWPPDVEVLNALGVVQVRRGALDDGIESFREASSADPNDGTAHFNLGKAYELRLHRSQRWSRSARSWAAHDDDRRLAVTHYRRYLEIGGPFEASAREALERLEWTSR